MHVHTTCTKHSFTACVVCASVCACAHVCVCVHMCVRACVCEHVCVLLSLPVILVLTLLCCAPSSLCRDIMLLSNTVIYDRQLQAGNSTVATATLCIPHWASTFPGQSEATDGQGGEGLKKTELADWLCYALDPSHPVVFVDTDKVGGGQNRADYRQDITHHFH